MIDWLAWVLLKKLLKTKRKTGLCDFLFSFFFFYWKLNLCKKGCKFIFEKLKILFKLCMLTFTFWLKILKWIEVSHFLLQKFPKLNLCVGKKIKPKKSLNSKTTLFFETFLSLSPHQQYRAICPDKTCLLDLWVSDGKFSAWLKALPMKVKKTHKVRFKVKKTHAQIFGSGSSRELFNFSASLQRCF